MSIKEKIQVIAISVVAALAIGAGIYFITRPLTPLDDTQDSPILVAGGSMYFGTDPGFRLQKVNNYLQLSDASYTAVTNRKFTEIDVEDSNDVITLYKTLSGSPRIDLTYCRNSCNGQGNSDVVTLKDDSGTQAITITNTDSTHAISQAARLLPNLLMHQRRGDWKIDHIDVYPDGSTKTTVMCTNGECSVVVHTCLMGYTCAPH
jgi:hypothetical protein